MRSVLRLAVAGALLGLASLPEAADAAFWGYDSAQMPCDVDRVVTPCPGATGEPATGMLSGITGMMGRWFGSSSAAAEQTPESDTPTTAPSSEQVAYQNL